MAERYVPVLRDAMGSSRKIFPVSGEKPTFVQHDEKNSPVAYRTLSADYLVGAAYSLEERRLEKEGIPLSDRKVQALESAKSAVGKIIDLETSRWIYHVDGGEELMSLPPEELEQRMAEIVFPIYEIVDPSLGKWREGFNSHDLPHAKRVAEIAQDLLDRIDRKDAAEIQKKVAIIAAYAHDVGNVFSRQHHAVMSADVLAATLPGIRQDHKMWQRIRQAINYHDSDLLVRISDTANLTSIERIRMMMEELHPATIAVLVADKLDVGPERLSISAQHMLSIDHDRHIGANNMGRSERLYFSPDGEEIMWDVVYDPSGQVRAPKNPSNFDQWKTDFIGVYPDRIKALGYGLFALYGRERVKIRLIKRLDGDIGEEYTINLLPGKIDEQIEEQRERVDWRTRRKLEDTGLIYSGK